MVHEVAQGLHEGLVGHAEVLVAAPGQYRGPFVMHRGGEFGGQAGLAHPRLTGQEGDPQLTRLVVDTLRELAGDGEVERQYKRWFLKKLPSGASLGLPMSPQLGVLIEAMAKKPE